jgi:adenosyl cobinamide kinase/adenosyl cobinamide phosphate guanylyltransferase
VNPRISEFLKALQVNHAQEHEHDGIGVYAVDLSNIYRKFNDPVKLAVVGSEFGQGSQSRSTEVLTNALLRLGIAGMQMVVLVLPEHDLGPEIEGFPAEWVILSAGDIQFIAGARRPKSEFARIIRNQVRLPLLSPYSTTFVVSPKMFFGREAELAEVQGRLQENVVIAGPRRIGKSSFAAELMRRLAAEHRWVIVTADCNQLPGDNDEEELFRMLTHSLGYKDRDTHKNRKLFGRTVRSGSWFEFFKYLTKERSDPVLVIIDEIDGLIDHDRTRSWATMRKLQGLLDAGQINTVVIGFKKLYHALYDVSFPLYRRSRAIILENLSREATGKLIREPMKELGITIPNESEVISEIFHETGGMPSIVQSICREAVRLLHQRGETQLTPQLVESILRSKSSPIDEDLRLIDYDLGQLEKALVYYSAPLNRLSVDEFVQHLGQQQVRDFGRDDVRMALDDLVLANIFREIERHTTYEFTVAALKQALERRPERPEILDRMLMEMRR